ncbi:MAG TPA: hypothetical protein QF873_00585 [Patescibacteria group bacterium]|nr:hypothetical protein [Patescibacteria group bacterium]
MKTHFAKPLPFTPDYLLRKAGYAPYHDRRTGKSSYTRKVTREFYPRFHLYVMETDKVVTFDLHLDQKKPSYSGTSAHAGEYDGTVVENEMARLKQALHRAARG